MVLKPKKESQETNTQPADQRVNIWPANFVEFMFENLKLVTPPTKREQTEKNIYETNEKTWFFMISSL